MEAHKNETRRPLRQNLDRWARISQKDLNIALESSSALWEERKCISEALSFTFTQNGMWFFLVRKRYIKFSPGAQMLSAQMR